jgi:hypothetical protein
MPSPSGVRRRIGLAISLAGLVALGLGGLEAVDLRSRLGPSRLLIAPSALAVTADGRLVVGSPASSKVHVYDARGQPVHRWRVPAEGSSFRMALVPPDRLEVAPDGAGTLLEYSLDGDLLSTRTDAGAYERIGAQIESAGATHGAARHAIEGGQIVTGEGADRRVLVNGFASHADLTLHVVRVTGLLLMGVLALLGGMLMTARRNPAS